MLVTIVRTVILYVVIILAMRIMGKRQVGDMQPGDLVVSLLISEIAAMPIEDVNKPMINGLIAVFMLVFLETVLSLVSLKSGKARRAINGRPAIVINRGRIDQSALRRLRMTPDDLLEGLRQEGIFDLTTVQYAIIETNGQLSVLKKSDSGGNMAVPVICDGRYQSEFMDSVGLSDGTVAQILQKRGITAEDVFIMTVDSNGKAVIIREEKKK